MKNRFIGALFIFLSFTTCKKGDHIHSNYSYWRVNNDSFRTNNVSATASKVVMFFSSQGDFNNHFDIRFPYPYFPTSGLFKVKCCTITGYNVALFSFIYKGQLYGPSLFSNTYVTPVLENNKAKYVLLPTWFVNFYNANDSVLIQGTFSEP